MNVTMYRVTGSEQEPVSDRELIDLVRRGDEDAFSVLLDRYLPVIRSGAHRYTAACGADPDDSVQEGTLSLFRAVRSYNVDAGIQFNTYAITAINNALSAQARKHIKNSRNDLGVDFDEIDTVRLMSQVAQDPGASPVEEQFLNQEDSRLRAQKVDTLLSEFEQRVLKLYLSGYTYQRISEILGISTKAVDNALQRVRRKLRSDS